MRGFDRSMRRATFEVEPAAAAKGTPYGLAAWGDHVIKFVGFDVPMPAPVVEKCVAAAHYGPDLKQQARNTAAPHAAVLPPATTTTRWSSTSPCGAVGGAGVARGHRGGERIGLHLVPGRGACGRGQGRTASLYCGCYPSRYFTAAS